MHPFLLFLAPLFLYRSTERFLKEREETVEMGRRLSCLLTFAPLLHLYVCMFFMYFCSFVHLYICTFVCLSCLVTSPHSNAGLDFTNQSVQNAVVNFTIILQDDFLKISTSQKTLTQTGSTEKLCETFFEQKSCLLNDT